MNVLGIAGSLRRGSYNRGLLEAARQLAPPAMTIEAFDLASIPLYNADLDSDDRRPAEVVRLNAAVSAAQAVLFSTPEYNHSVPGVLQNAIDWVSRPGNNSVLKGKPVAIMGASAGMVGSARGQQQLKLVLLSTLSCVMPHVGVVVGQAKEKFDASGALAHDATRQFVGVFLKDFESWTQRFI
jgi:chromate reductase